MKRIVNMMKVIAVSLISVVVAIFLWPFFAAGVFSYFASGMRFNRWLSSAFALLAAVIWRLGFGEWPLRVGSGSATNWYIETFLAVVNWAFAAIFVSAFAHGTAKVVEGYKFTKTRHA